MGASAVAAQADDNLSSILAQGPAARTDQAFLLLARQAPGHVRPTRKIRTAPSRQLAAFKRPKAIRLVDELPRNAMGKVQKALMRTEYSRLFSKS